MHKNMSCLSGIEQELSEIENGLASLQSTINNRETDLSLDVQKHLAALYCRKLHLKYLICTIQKGISQPDRSIRREIRKNCSSLRREYNRVIKVLSH